MPPLNSRTRLLLWQRRKSQIWLHDPHVREQLRRLLALDARVHNHIIA